MKRLLWTVERLGMRRAPAVGGIWGKGLLLAALLALLAGCAPIPPAPALPNATAESAASEVQSPAAVPPPTEDLAKLRANSWQWVAMEAAVGRTEIKDPAAYRLTFNVDATLGIAADCATAGGSYQGESGKLEIDIEKGGQDCGAGSRAGELLAALAAATRYTFDGDRLRMDIAGESGASTLIFEPTTLPAPVPSE